MTIALTAVVHPSRRLRAALGLYGAGQAVLALLLAGGWGGPLGGAGLAGLGCALAAGLAWWRACRFGTPQRIDVSGIGALRLTVQRKTGGAAEEGEAMRLLPGSTLWPRLLCLVLRDAGGRRRLLLVAPDSVTADEFRALAVALRSIAGRDNIFFEKNKIV